MIYDGDVIEHYGIKGMKWGIRRTPAQLGHAVANGARKVKSAVTTASSKRKAKKKAEEDKKQQEDTEAKKQRVLKSRSAKLLYENAGLFSTQELQNAYNRLNLERNISNLAASEKSKGRKFVDSAITGTRKAGDFLQSTNKVLNQGRAFAKFFTTGKTDKKTNDSSKKESQTKSESKKSNDDDFDFSKFTGKHFTWNSNMSGVKSEAASVLRDAGRDFAKDFKDAPQALEKAITLAGQDYVDDRKRRR